MLCLGVLIARFLLFARPNFFPWRLPLILRLAISTPLLPWQHKKGGGLSPPPILDQFPLDVTGPVDTSLPCAASVYAAITPRYSWRSRMCLRKRAIRATWRDLISAMVGTASVSASASVSVARFSCSRIFRTSGVSALPNVASNEAVAGADEALLGRDVPVFLDFPELPDFEMVRRLCDCILVCPIVDCC